MLDLGDVPARGQFTPHGSVWLRGVTTSPTRWLSPSRSARGGKGKGIGYSETAGREGGRLAVAAGSAASPFPTKWYIDVGKPIDPGYAPEMADRPMVVNEVTDLVRTTMQRMIDSRLARRRSVFLEDE